MEHNSFSRVLVRGTALVALLVAIILSYFAFKNFEHLSADDFQKSVQIHTEFQGEVNCAEGEVSFKGLLPYTFKTKGHEYEVDIVITTKVSAPLCTDNVYPSVSSVSSMLKTYELDFEEAVNTLVLYPNVMTGLSKENRAIAKEIALKLSKDNPRLAVSEAAAYLQKAQKERERQENVDIYTPNLILGI